jgi:hypothetical protein
VTVKAVWHAVKESARHIGVKRLAPHDLRRNCPRLCHASGGELEQIQFLLGHVRSRRPNANLAASSGFDQPSMIVLASSRIPEPGAAVGVLPANRQEWKNPVYIELNVDVSLSASVSN